MAAAIFGTPSVDAPNFLPVIGPRLHAKLAPSPLPPPGYYSAVGDTAENRTGGAVPIAQQCSRDRLF